MRRIVVATLLLLSLPASRATAQTWISATSDGATVTGLFHSGTGNEGQLYCFRATDSIGSYKPIQTINGTPIGSGTTCRNGAFTNGTFTIKVAVSSTLEAVTLTAMNTNFQPIAYIGYAPPAPPGPPRESAPTIDFEPLTAPLRTDTTFLATGPGLRTSCTFGGSLSPLRFTVDVTRVVGDLADDGTLADVGTLIANGVVTHTTMLRIRAFDVDVAGGIGSPALPEFDSVFLNGQYIGNLTGENNAWHTSKFIVPTDLVKFGQRNPGQAPTAGRNEIEIFIDAHNVADNGRSFYCTAIDWSALSFDALAPTIMVHGNNSEGAFFDNQQSLLNEQLGFGFVQPFRLQKVPFDNTIDMATASVDDHAELLGFLIPAKAAEFGASHAHLVAHSKGGLDARAFLTQTMPPGFAVLSLTTLSTPHHGSVGANYATDVTWANSMHADDQGRALLALLAGSDAGTPDLRVEMATRFNDRNAKLLPRTSTLDFVTRPVAYWSISADANLDDSRSGGEPTIQIEETRGLHQGLLPGGVFAWLMQSVYRVVGEVATTRVTFKEVIDPRTSMRKQVVSLDEVPTRRFQLNDFLVTLESARMTRFTELATLRANHATVANPYTGQAVIEAIRLTQPLREPQ